MALVVAHSDATVGRVAVPPPFFSGNTETEDENDYIFLFNQIATANHWDNQRKLELFPAFLRGNAQDCYRRISFADRSTWDLLVTNFLCELNPVHKQELLRSQLLSRIKGPTESVADYTRNIEKLGNRAYANVAHEDRQSFLLDIFCRGLHDNLRPWVVSFRPSTLVEAVTRASSQESIELIYNLDTPMLPQPIGVAAVADKNWLTAVDYQIDSKLESLFKQQKKELISLIEEKLKSFAIQTCSAEPPQPFQRNQRTIDGQIVCNFCHKKNHFAKNCRVRLGHNRIPTVTTNDVSPLPSWQNTNPEMTHWYQQNRPAASVYHASGTITTSPNTQALSDTDTMNRQSHKTSAVYVYQDSDSDSEFDDDEMDPNEQIALSMYGETLDSRINAIQKNSSVDETGNEEMDNVVNTETFTNVSIIIAEVAESCDISSALCKAAVAKISITEAETTDYFAAAYIPSRSQIRPLCIAPVSSAETVRQETEISLTEKKQFDSNILNVKTGRTILFLSNCLESNCRKNNISPAITFQLTLSIPKLLVLMMLLTLLIQSVKVKSIRNEKCHRKEPKLQKGRVVLGTIETKLISESSVVTRIVENSVSKSVVNSCTHEVRRSNHQPTEIKPTANHQITRPKSIIWHVASDKRRKKCKKHFYCVSTTEEFTTTINGQRYCCSFQKLVINVVLICSLLADMQIRRQTLPSQERLKMKDIYNRSLSTFQQNLAKKKRL